ncbi:hypothetical protein [Phenylobacterium sp.]|uniref:hypothetical protein n=1 Tax=Phenylobacterium sp. TaxID=1871053 RepID=UPI0035C84B9B
MKVWLRAASVAAIAYGLTPAVGQAQSLDDVLRRLERLEQENQALRQEVESLKAGGAPVLPGPVATAPAAAADAPPAVPVPEVEAPTPVNDTVEARVELNSGYFISRASDVTYRMLDPTTHTSRKPLMLLDARRQGDLRDGGVYLGGAITALVDYQETNRNSKFGYLMRHPTSANQIGETASEAVLHSAQLSVTANVTPWITAYAELLYDPEQSFGSGTITALTRNQMQLRKGYVLFGDLAESPWYAAVGKMEAPFGLMDTVSPFTASTVWHAFGGLAWGALAGYSGDGLNVAVEAVQGGSQFRSVATSVEGTNVPSRLNNFVVDANYTFDLGGEGRDLMAGASYLHGSAYCHAFPVVHFNPCVDDNPAYAVYGQLHYDRWTANAEFAKTLEEWPGTFNPTPPLNQFEASKVTSWGVGVRYAADLGGHELHLSGEFSTYIAGPEGAPWHRQDQLVFGLAAFPASHVKLFSEVVLVKGYVPLNFLSGGNLGPGVTWSDADGRTTVLLAGANVAF